MYSVCLMVSKLFLSEYGEAGFSSKFYYARAEPLFCSLKLLFYHILVAVVVMVF